MLLISRKSDYALVALAGLARDGSSSARELAERFRLPLPALRNILKRLVRGGVLRSTQGPAGGYALARPAERITMGEVVTIIDGPVRLMPCCDPESDPELVACQREGFCQIRSTVQSVHRRMASVLDDVSIATLAAEDTPTFESPGRVRMSVGAAASETE